MSDFVTVLDCRAGKRSAKLYTDPTQPPEGYDAGNAFKPHRVSVDSLDALQALLEELRTDTKAMVIRGSLRADAGSTNGEVLRRCVDSDEGTAPFERASHRWLMVDADNTSTPFDADAREQSVRNWRAALPECLREAGLVFQFSAKQHLSATVRGHAWFWCAGELYDDRTLRTWARRHGLDGSLYTPVQPHYTSDPVFEGCTDPLAPRELIRLEGGDALLDVVLADVALGNAPVKKVGTIVLDELDEPRQTPEAVEARARMADALELYFDGGKRFPMCGAIGGACAKAGLPPEECDAVVLELFDRVGAEGGIDMRRAYALGAYALEDPKQALGITALAELTKRDDGRMNTAAVKFEGVLNAFAKSLQPQPPPAAVAATSGDEQPLHALCKPDDPHAPIKPLHYICKKYGIALGKVSLLTGYAGAGKSPLAMLFGLCVAGGVNFLGAPVEQRRMYLLNFEGNDLPLTRRVRMSRALGIDHTAIPFSILRMRAFLEEQMLELIAKQIEFDIAREGRAPGFIIDTLTSATPQGDQNSATYAAPLFVLGNIGDEYSAPMMVLAHHNKGEGKDALQSVSGHNAIVSASQTVIAIRTDPADANKVQLRCGRAPEKRFDNTTIRWEDIAHPGAQETGLRDWGLRAEVLTESAVAEENPEVVMVREIAKALENKPYGLTANAICAQVTGRKGAVLDMLKALAGKHSVVEFDETSGNYRKVKL